VDILYEEDLPLTRKGEDWKNPPEVGEKGVRGVLFYDLLQIKRLRKKYSRRNSQGEKTERIYRLRKKCEAQKLLSGGERKKFRRPS